jgi:hypothetical protein
MFWNLWRLNARSDGNLDIVVPLRRRSECGKSSFVTEDACHHGKGRAGRPSVTAETVDRVRETFTRSPRKSVQRASRQAQHTGAHSEEGSMETTAVVPYKLQLVQNTAIIYTHPAECGQSVQLLDVKLLVHRHRIISNVTRQKYY